MLEKQLQTKCLKYAASLGIFKWKFQDKFNAGFPDAMLAYKGGVLFIEFKQKGKKPTPLQSAVHQKMRNAGLLVEVIDDFEKFKSILKLWMSAIDKEEAQWN